MEITSKHELDKYILSRKYHCPWCQQLQAQVAKKGLVAIEQWGGVVCGGVESMQILLSELKTGVKHEPIHLDECYEG